MTPSISIGIDREQLLRRADFLLSRAEVSHIVSDEERTTPPNRAESRRWSERDALERARVATLLRDAALILLILGDYDAGRRTLVRAGRALIDLGVPSGYLLLAVAVTGAPSRDWEVHVYVAPQSYVDQLVTAPLLREEITTGISPALRRDEDRERTDRRPLLQSALRTPRQLLSLYQAIRILGGLSDLAGEIRDRLHDVPDTPVGVTETPMRRYLTLFDEVLEGSLSGRGREVLRTLVNRRREVLESAQADEYHWPRLLRPDAVIDLDVLALCVASTDTGIDARAAIEAIMHDYGSVVSLPFDIADGLRER